MSALSCRSSLEARRAQKRLLGAEIHTGTGNANREQQLDHNNGKSSRDGHAKRQKRQSIKKGKNYDGTLSALNINDGIVTQGSTEHSSSLRVMSNDVVLTKIAKLLPIGCIRDLRETCTNWNRNFVPHLKDNHPEIGLGNCAKARKRTMQMQDFASLVKSSSAIPFSNYSFTFNYCRGPGIPEPDITDFGNHLHKRNCMLDFITSFGHTITKLSISWDQETDLEISQLSKIVFEWTPNLAKLELQVPSISSEENEPSPEPKKTLPKLKQLIVSSTAAVRAGRISANPAFNQLMSDIIQGATNLDCLEVFDDSSSRYLLGPTLAQLQDESFTNLCKLKTLKVSTFAITDLQYLIQLAQRSKTDSMKLESFSIMIGSSLDRDETPRLVNSFLTSQSSTLKALTIILEPAARDNNQDPTRHPVFIPRMEKLKELEILGLGEWKQSPFKLELEKESVSDTLPQLKKMSYKHNGGRDLNSVDPIFRGSITDLQVKTEPYSYFISDAHLIPFVTRLELTLGLSFFNYKDVHIDIKQLARVWTAWPALTTLQMSFDAGEHKSGVEFDLDVWLTGVPRGNIERLKRELDSIPQSGISLDSLKTMLKKYRMRAGIGGLGQLREFTIAFDSDNKPELSDMGGYFGIALAGPLLQRLAIRGAVSDMVSQHCHTFMRNTLGPLVDITL